MASDTGISLNDIGNLWLDYERIKHGIDVETVSDDRNVPDYQDVVDGRTAGDDNSPAGLGGSIPWLAVAAGVLVAGFAFAAFKS